MTLSDIDAAERRMDVHYCSLNGQTFCGLNASTVHVTHRSEDFDCRACARAFLSASCFDDDPKSCVAHGRVARLAYPKMEVVRGAL